MIEKKSVNTKILLKSGFWYSAASFLTRAFAFLTMPLFLRLLSKDQYGVFSSFTNYQATLLIICGLETYSTVNRARFDFKEKDELNGYITSSLLLSTIFTGILFVLFLLFPVVFDRIFLLERIYIYIMFGYLFTYPAFAMFMAKQRIEYKYKLSTIIAFVSLIVAYIISFILTLKMDNDRLLGRIFGQYIVYILLGLFFYLYFIIKNHHITFKAWKYALRIGLPMVFAFLGSQILLSSDVFVVKHLCSDEYVSYLSVSHSCSHIVLLLVQAINNAWAPWFFDMLKEKNMSTINKAYRIYLWLTVFWTLAVVLFGPELILILGGESYLVSKDILPVYILCGVFTVLTSQFTNLETYYKKPEYSAVFTGIVAVLNFVFNIIGVKYWGYKMVAYSTLICQLILVLLHYIFSRKFGVRDIIPPKRLLAIILVSLILIPIAFLLYQNNIIRFAIVGLILIVILVLFMLNKDKVVSLIKRFKEKK